MHMAPSPGRVTPWTPADVRTQRAFAPEPAQTPRGRHAQLLEFAAARRLRAIDRAGAGRSEDAGYWKAVAPTAVHKAATLREDRSFASLPD
jgi:hypothetical protein